MDNILNKITQKIIKKNAYINTKNAIKKYGLEHTEDKIKTIYKDYPKIKNILLQTLYEIWKS